VSKKINETRRLRTLLKTLDDDLVALDQHIPSKRSSGKLSPQERKMQRKLDEEWSRRDRVYAMYLRGFTPANISKKLGISRGRVWQDIAAKKWEAKRLLKDDGIEIARGRLKELLRTEWHFYMKKHQSEEVRLEHAKLIQELLKDIATLNGFDWKEPASQTMINLFGNKQSITIGDRPLNDLNEEELNDYIRREEREIREINPLEKGSNKKKRD